MTYQIEQQLCSCCHQCRVNCPVNAIQYKGTKYWIDQDKCIGCGKCACICHNGVIHKVGVSPEKPPAHQPEQINCDAVVVGGGGSGLVAAARLAARTGKKVIVLEKAAEAGGNTWYAGGFSRVPYSKLHREKGIPDTRDDQLRQLMMNVCWELDHHLVHNVFEATEQLIDWMIDDCGCQEDLVLEEGFIPGGDKQKGCYRVVSLNKTVPKYKRPDRSIGPGGMGSYLVTKMLEKCRELGVEVRYSTEAVKILRDKDGRISGVVARDGGGTVEIACRACILASGCFSRNEEMLRRANPQIFEPGEPVHFFSVPTCTGDGIRMAEEIGAQIDYKRLRALTLGPAHHPFGSATVSLVREPDCVLFNMNGRRWANETRNVMVLRHEFEKQPGKIAYAVADSVIVEKAIGRLKARRTDGDVGMAIYEQYQQEIDLEATLEVPTKKADTLEELAEKMGVPADTFVNEITRYNQLCKQGHDDDFFKAPEYLTPVEKPPFYAFFCKRFQENAMGGIVTDSQTRVLDSTGAVVDGLYAVGDNARGVILGGDKSVDFVESVISAFGWAAASGFIAGEAAAAQLS